jgi:glutamyl-Q tRNA(Asp) synthetase
LPKSSTGTATTADPALRRRGAAEPLEAPYRGRFAPSPTGPLHYGSLFAAAGSWLEARARGGEWLVRIEDLDPPREPPGAADEILRALEAFGLWWDGEVLYQSHRQDAYQAALATLAEAGWAYPCICSRKDIEDANRLLGQGGERRYPGICRTLPAALGRKTRIVRARTTAERIGLADRLQGEYAQVLESAAGDFVLRRREGYIAYQLAVVVDDCAQGITDVVRGIDLLDSTPRQLWLQRLLGYPTPGYMHLPVVTGPGGDKLSKQTGAPGVAATNAAQTAWQILRDLGQVPPAELAGARPGEIWAWAISHWRPQQLCGIRSIPAS